jgi:hypothetical protein
MVQTLMQLYYKLTELSKKATLAKPRGAIAAAFVILDPTCATIG